MKRVTLFNEVDKVRGRKTVDKSWYRRPGGAENANKLVRSEKACLKPLDAIRGQWTGLRVETPVPRDLIARRLGSGYWLRKRKKPLGELVAVGTMVLEPAHGPARMVQ